RSRSARRGLPPRLFDGRAGVFTAGEAVIVAAIVREKEQTHQPYAHHEAENDAQHHREGSLTAHTRVTDVRCKISEIKPGEKDHPSDYPDQNQGRLERRHFSVTTYIYGPLANRTDPTAAGSRKCC